MAQILVSELTDATTADNGAGIFDQLINAVELHITEQYNDSRLTGAEYANVYLGAMQSVLAESIKFALGKQQADKQAELLVEQIKSEIKNNEAGGVIDLGKQKIQEEIDLTIGQTAKVYEDIAASRQDTLRKNLLNAQQVIKTQKEGVLIDVQGTELALMGPIERGLKTEQTIAVTSGALNDTNRANAEVARNNAEVTKITAEIARINADAARITAETTKVTPEIAKLTAETSMMTAREVEMTADTIRKDLESTAKIALMAAQTNGFAADIRAKVLKQCMENWAVNLSIADVGVVPPAADSTAISGQITALLAMA